MIYRLAGRYCKREKARQLDAKAYHYEIEDEVLYHFYNARNRNLPKGQRIIKQLAIPVPLRKEVLEAYHDSITGCHQGQERTYDAIRQKYYWPSMYSDITTYVKTCELC